jgi:hypothetical protein
MDECSALEDAARWLVDHMCMTPDEPSPILSAKAKLERATELVSV